MNPTSELPMQSADLNRKDKHMAEEKAKTLNGETSDTRAGDGGYQMKE